VAPKPKPEPAKDVKVPPKPRWKPKPPPKPIAKKPKPKAKPEKVATPKQKPAPVKKKKDFSLKRIAALLDKAKKDDAPEVKKEEKKKFDQVKPPEPKQPAVVSATAERQEFGQPLTISEVDAVRAKIETCWSMPSGARDAEKLVVRIKFRLNPDGSIQGVPSIVNSGYGGSNDRYYRIAAEAARRAVQKCEPYDMLPRSKYKRWQDMEMTFDPKEMMGG
jgi:outer membrane biosynthesis protein TonB